MEGMYTLRTIINLCKNERPYTIVWEKLVVGNIHEKKIHGKKFSS